MGIISEHHIFLSEDGSAGLQTRLKESISRAIWDGRFQPGDRLPATRALARHLGISRITVSLAYDALLSTGYVTSHARSGFYVAPDAPNRRDTVDASAPASDASLNWSARLGPVGPALGGQAKPADWRRFRYPFIFGEPDLDRFPVDDWRDCMRQALGKRHFETIADDAGDRDDPLLVEQIAKRSVTGRGVVAEPEDILVTAGAQNALWLVANALLNRHPGGKVVMEEPGYPELRHLLTHLGAEVVPVPVDGEGLLVDAIPEGTLAVFITPSHQAPTGVTMSMARRHALLTLAEARDFVVVEDDYDFEMSYQTPSLPALKALDETGRVLYVGSFSKSIFPGLRLGYLVADPVLIDHTRALRTLAGRHAPGITQRTVAYFLSSGHYNAHARRMRMRMARRRAALHEALLKHRLVAPHSPVTGGAAFWLDGPKGMDAVPLADTLRTQGVLIEPGAPFYAHPTPPRNTIRLGYSVIPVARIAEGIDLIAEGISGQARA